MISLLSFVLASSGGNPAPMIIGVIVGLACAVWAFQRAEKLGRSPILWAAVCFLFGLVGMLVFWLASRNDTQPHDLGHGA